MGHPGTFVLSRSLMVAVPAKESAVSNHLVSGLRASGASLHMTEHRMKFQGWTRGFGSAPGGGHHFDRQCRSFQWLFRFPAPSITYCVSAHWLLVDEEQLTTSLSFQLCGITRHFSSDSTFAIVGFPSSPVSLVFRFSFSHGELRSGIDEPRNTKDSSKNTTLSC